MLLVSQLIGLAALLLLSAYFSACETALTSLGKLKMKSLIEKEGRRAELLSSWLGDPSRLLATILVGNNIVNVAFSILFTFVLLHFFGSTAAGKVGAISTAVVVLLILVFGEITPKTYARQNAERIALRTISSLNLLSRALSPLIGLLVFVVPGGRKTKARPFMTEEEIKRMISLGEEEGVLEEEEKEMIDSIFKFGDTKVQEVMVPRSDMVTIEANQDLDDILKLLLGAGHSRIPVFERRIDNIIGILYAKDLLNLWEESSRAKLKVKDLIRPAYFIPETKKVNELLREFQKQRIHLAMVVDEYGGTAGLVTLEDLLEEIVGEIEDEYDKDKERIEILEEGIALVDGKTDIGEVNECLGIKLPEEEGVETVAGFVVDRLGRVPKVGEELIYQGTKITVVEADRRRAIKVKIKLKEAQ
ncbi:hemolysin family protein [candidate division NPL-UPA2 bacterium]|nr:hemolysin family protein [candidate division NPL-UPA2 bacterium]